MIWSRSCRQFDGCDSKGPNVSFEVIASDLFHDFRCHPAWGANKCVSGFGSVHVTSSDQPGRNTKVGDLHLTLGSQQNIAGFDITMDVACKQRGCTLSFQFAEIFRAVIKH